MLLLLLLALPMSVFLLLLIDAGLETMFDLAQQFSHRICLLKKCLRMGLKR